MIKDEKRYQQEQPMPDSTKLIELWHEDKEKLKEKDFRNDPWRLAYNAFLCGFGRGIAVNKQEQPKVKGWAARDKDGMLRMHEEKPKRSKCLWESTGASHDISEFFSDNFIDWSDEPIEVELAIINTKIAK